MKNRKVTELSLKSPILGRSGIPLTREERSDLTWWTIQSNYIAIR